MAGLRSRAGSVVRSLTALGSLTVAAFVFMGAFSGTWSSGPDIVAFVASAEAAEGPGLIEDAFGDCEQRDQREHTPATCDGSCSAVAKVCVKKCVVDQKPCLDKCNINEDDNPKNLKPKDQACAKACFNKSRPCQERCQVRRASCARGCPH